MPHSILPSTGESPNYVPIWRWLHGCCELAILHWRSDWIRSSLDPPIFWGLFDMVEMELGPGIWRFLEMMDPQVTLGFNTKSWSSMTWMIWGYPHDLGNFHMYPYVLILQWTQALSEWATSGPGVHVLHGMRPSKGLKKTAPGMVAGSTHRNFQV